MAKLNRLNALSVQRATRPGLLMDGGGLGLQISREGSKSWIFRFSLNKKTRTMGLGPINTISLASARELAFECRKQVKSGIDPIEARQRSRANSVAENLKIITFDQCAEAYISAHRVSWRNIKHGDQWTNTLKTYASPVIGRLPVQVVDTSLVMRILEPIWSTKNETASRVRSRIELVLAWATVRGYRSGQNPAIWRNHLDKLLPARARVQKVRHFAALPFEEIGEFMAKLRKEDGTGARALEFMILTASRTSETLKARMQEFNFDESIWTIPSERMKTGVEHRVPLSPRALAIALEMRAQVEGEFLFSGARKKRPLSNMALLKVIRRIGYKVTGHGFRSTFRDWAAERTNFSHEVCEQALAHTIRNKVESAYRRGDLLLKRQVLMTEWAKYCETSQQNVAQIISLTQSM